jgi:hypothetical protein
MKTDGVFHADPSELLFLPLGGSNEIGMNLNLYCYGGKWLMVDLGITFGDETTPGVDVIMPDPSFVESGWSSLMVTRTISARSLIFGSVCAARSTRHRSPRRWCAASWPMSISSGRLS